MVDRRPSPLLLFCLRTAKPCDVPFLFTKVADCLLESAIIRVMFSTTAATCTVSWLTPWWRGITWNIVYLFRGVTS